MLNGSGRMPAKGEVGGTIAKGERDLPGQDDANSVISLGPGYIVAFGRSGYEGAFYASHLM